MGLSDEVWEELCTDPGALHRPQRVVDTCGGKDSATAPAVLLDWRTAAASAREMSQLASAELRTEEDQQTSEEDQHDTSTQGAKARGGQQERQRTNEMHDFFSCVGLRSPLKIAEEHILGTIKRLDSACQRAMNLFLPEGLDTADKKALFRGSSSRATQRFSPYPRKVSSASAAIRAVSSPHGRATPTAGSHAHADSHSHMMTLSEQSKNSLQKRRQLARAVCSDAWARPWRDGVRECDGEIVLIAGRQRQDMTEEGSHLAETEGSAGGSKPHTLFAPFLIKTPHNRSE